MDAQAHKKAFGRRIAELRGACGLSQNGLGARVHERQSTISKWENGHISPPVDKVVGLAAALEVTVSELFDIPMGGDCDAHMAAVS